MLNNETPLLEVVVRVVVIYLTLLVFVRCAGKREVGQLGPLDFLSMLLLSETVSPALTKQDVSLSASLTAAATLLALTAIVSHLTYRWSSVERLIDGVPTKLIEDGDLVERACRQERISAQDLAMALRKEGVEDLRDVKSAYVEPTGRVTVIKRAQA